MVGSNNSTTMGSRDTHATRVLLLLLAVTLVVSSSCGFISYRLLMAQLAASVLDQPLGVFWEAWTLLEHGFYGEMPSARERTYGAIRGVLALLGDPYTVFLEPQSGQAERERLAGTYGGIGVDLWRDESGAVILSPFPGTPAEGAGVQAGDTLLAVDGQPVDAASLEEIGAMLHGEDGTAITLTLVRPPAPPFDLVVVRAQISVPSVSYRVLREDPAIGYLRATGFTERTAEEASAALQALLDAGIVGLVLDLRDNGGGLILPALDVADLFLDEGVLLYEVRRGGEETAFRASESQMGPGLPLVVLVNGSTASAGEVLAGILQVRGRAVLLGEPTYGKGSVQLVYTLSDGSSLHVTAAVWLLPNREPVGPAGLAPDVPVASESTPEDVQLDRAIELLLTGE